MALFTAIKKFPDKHYKDDEPIEMELVPDEIFYKDMPNFEIQKTKQKFLKERGELLKKKAIIENLLQKKISDISISDNIDDIRTNFFFKNLYYQWDEIINKKVQIQNKETPFSLSVEQAEQIYDKIKILDSNLEYINLIIQLLEKLSTPQLISKVLPTYNGLGNTITKTQKELITPFFCKKNKTENEEKILQEILVNHVVNDKDFTDEQKKEILLYIKDNNYDKVLNNYLMYPLTRDEKRILRALREEVYEQIKTQKITGIAQTSYEAYIPYNKFFTIYGVHNDDKTTKPIKDVLFGKSTKGLHKTIFLEDKTLLRTSLILQIQEIKGKINLFKKTVGIGFIITMPSFLFVGEDKLNAQDYFNQENEGFRKLMKEGKMAQSNAVSNIACKLEMLCHSTIKNKKKKDKIIILDSKTLIEISGYKKRYKKSPTEIKNKIKNILDTFVKIGYLIESWHTGIGKFKQEQYTLKPLNIS